MDMTWFIKMNIKVYEIVSQLIFTVIYIRVNGIYHKNK